MGKKLFAGVLTQVVRVKRNRMHDAFCNFANKKVLGCNVLLGC